MGPEEPAPVSQQTTYANAAAEPEGEISLAAASDRAREAIVRSYRIVKVPDYFLDEWLPLLGPSRWLAVLAFRQLAFIHKCKEKTGQQPSETTYRELASWAGQSRPQMHKLLRSPGLMTWFVEPEQGTLGEHPGSRSERRTYLVRIEVPLTPADQARVQSFLEANRPSDDEGWLRILHDALAAKKAPLPTKGSLPKHPKSIQRMVRELRDPDQPLPEEIDWACDELLERWQTQNFGQVTHYFLKKWLPHLTPGLGCLIIWSRRHANRQPEGQIGRLASVGWSGMAQAVGVSGKSVRRWFGDQERYPHTLQFVRPVPVYAGAGEIERLTRDELTIGGQRLHLSPATVVRHNLRVGDFVQATAERQDQALQALALQLADEREASRIFRETGLRFDIKLTDPIHADDQPYYRALLESQTMPDSEAAVLHATVALAERSTGVAGRNGGTKVDNPRTTIDIPYAELNPMATELDIAGAEVDNRRTDIHGPDTPGDNRRSQVDNHGTPVDALRSALRESQELSEDVSEEQLQAATLDSRNGEGTGGGPPHAVVAPVSEWDIEGILTQAAIPKRDKLALLSESETGAQDFVAWLLWSLATKSIEVPVLHAVSRVRKKETPPAGFVALAAERPAGLLRLLQGFDLEVSDGFERPIRQLRRNDALRRLAELGAVRSQTDTPLEVVIAHEAAGADVEGDVVVNHGPDEAVNEGGLGVTEAWRAAKSQLQIQLPRTIYETWLRDVEVASFEAPDTILLRAGNLYAKEWLEDRASSTVQKVLAGVVGRPVRIEFTVVE